MHGSGEGRSSRAAAGAAAGPAPDLAAEELIRQYVPHQSVTAFAWSAIRHIVPQVADYALHLFWYCLHAFVHGPNLSC